jgi:pyrroloquinoline quinone (PQQ) biosynthesis protein C
MEAGERSARNAFTSRFEQAAWLLAEILHRRDYWAARRHPFHERWFAGDLGEAELQLYAGEHHHAVLALAHASRRAAGLADGMLREELVLLADERDGEVELWCEFARAAGWTGSSSWYYAADPLAETVACAETCTGDAERSLAEHLVTMFALETARMEVAGPQLDALLGRYGFPDDRSTRYFRQCCRADAGPDGLTAAAVTGLLPVADPFALVRRAELTYRSCWELLDGVERFSRDCGLTRAAGP